VSTPPNQLPPPPPVPPSQTASPTQVVGQQTAPSTSVPVTSGPIYTANPGHTNSLAVISLVAGIGSFFAHIIPGIGGLTVAIVAIVTGYMARNQIKQTGEQGYGMATAGMIIGIIHLVLLALVVIGLIFAIFVFGIALFGITSRSTSGG
jgi:uncharacterized protein DUF4190